MFSFLTTRAPNDIHQFEQKRLPILLNGHEFTAKVILVQSVLNNKAFWVMLNPIILDIHNLAFLGCT